MLSILYIYIDIKVCYGNKQDLVVNMIKKFYEKFVQRICLKNSKVQLFDEIPGSCLSYSSPQYFHIYLVINIFFIAAVKIRFEGSLDATDAQISSAVKDWLKQAKHRHACQLAKKIT